MFILERKTFSLTTVYVSIENQSGFYLPMNTIQTSIKTEFSRPVNFPTLETKKGYYFSALIRYKVSHTYEHAHIHTHTKMK